MGIDYDELFKKEAFNNLEASQKEALKKLAINLNNKSTNESMAIIMDFMKTMPKGRQLSPEEQAAMINVMKETLPPADQIKFQNILKMMEIMKPRR